MKEMMAVMEDARKTAPEPLGRKAFRVCCPKTKYPTIPAGR